MSDQEQFKFELSLSVLNHLGRNLYRNFITVLGEAISNSWDAGAENVHIYIDRDNESFVVKDDGDGMTAEDFQEKFLTVGYSKRKEKGSTSSIDRPFIGAKGIGKLALLSCSDVVNVISKTNTTDYVGGVINNSELDDAIEHDLKPNDYPLGELDQNKFTEFTSDHAKGTIILFEGTKENIRNTVPYLRKLIALYFRFSLVDESFNIYVNDELVTLEDLKSLSETTEFVWNINELQDPYLETLTKLAASPVPLSTELNIKGFIGSVTKPRYLKVIGTEERVKVDLFVNGRLREKDVLKHLPTARIAESYIYGQIHYDELDGDGEDRFTSSREGVFESDEKYQQLISILKSDLIPKIIDKWDELRVERGQDGDDENPRKTPKQRRASSLFHMASRGYSNTGGSDNTGSNDDEGNSDMDDLVSRWIKELEPEAEFNIPAYADCFLSENLIRKYITHKGDPLTPPAQREADEWKGREAQRKNEAGISFDIRQDSDDLNYLGMDFLAKSVEGNNPGPNTASLVRDSVEYKPMRNAVGHTGLLSENAKARLTLVYENIKSRLRTLLSSDA